MGYAAELDNLDLLKEAQKNSQHMNAEKILQSCCRFPHGWLQQVVDLANPVVLLRATPPVRPHNFLGILKEYKFPPPLNFTFNWEDQHGY